MNNRAIFFSMDALIALVIVLISVLVIYPTLNENTKEVYIQRDLIKVLSDLKIGEINSSYVTVLINNGKIDNLEKPVLEQLAELYVTNETSAKILAQEILDLIDTDKNIGFWFGNKLVASRNNTPIDSAEEIIVERQVISGIQEGGSITAFSGRAYLTNSLQNKYFYFGGYVGEGNLSANISYDGNISSVIMELAIEKNFSVYVNSKFAGSYNASSSEYTPRSYSIPIGNFSSGSNLLEIKGNYLGIAGGFVKVSYEPAVSYSLEERKYLPGIEGVVNLYDGLSIPGQLKNMSIFLKYNNSIKTFLKIGSVVVYNRSTSGLENISINNSYLSSILNYSALSNKTTPIRFGLEDASYVTNITLPADVFSVVDLSGSMLPSCSGGGFWCCLFSGNFCGTSATCSSCSGTWSDPIGAAKNSTKQFSSKVLNDSDNRVGLVGYKTSVSISDTHNLSKNGTSLNNTVNNWSASGNTCICCGINSAVNSLVNNSSSSNFRSVVVMSDGAATTTCTEQPNSTATADAIQAACDAYLKHGIVVYSVGFGSSADEDTLQDIANCGGGSYYYGSVSSLLSVYEDIAQEIIDASFFEQAINVTGNYYSRLYPESYIEFIYDKASIPFGLITTTEKTFSSVYGGEFSLPENSTILDAKVISYSGSWWTDLLKINNTAVYNLSSYGNEYLTLGDPYSINLPLNKINSTNIVNLTTGLSPANSSSGSLSNKIIYTILQSDIATYSSISSVSVGCNWFIEFEDLTNLTVEIPEGYNQTEDCYYASSGQNISNENDAMQSSVLRLFELLDYDNDGKIDVFFNDQDLGITSSEISGIPFEWSTEIQVRVWS